jgi:hypothetical protein
MEQHDHSEEFKQDVAKPEGDTQAQAQTDAVPNRRSFLTRAAIGVAGAASLMAITSQAGMAAESSNAATKSKILERIKLHMAAQDIVPIEEAGGGEGVYIKNAHALYLKK